MEEDKAEYLEMEVGRYDDEDYDINIQENSKLSSEADSNKIEDKTTSCGEVEVSLMLSDDSENIDEVEDNRRQNNEYLPNLYIYIVFQCYV